MDDVVPNSVSIKHTDDPVFGGPSRVVAHCDSGDITVFTFYPDEFSFSREELEGKTIGEMRALPHVRHVLPVPADMSWEPEQTYRIRRVRGGFILKDKRNSERVFVSREDLFAFLFPDSIFTNGPDPHYGPGEPVTVVATISAESDIQNFGRKLTGILVGKMASRADTILALFKQGKFPYHEMFEDGVMELCNWVRELGKELRGD